MRNPIDVNLGRGFIRVIDKGDVYRGQNPNNPKANHYFSKRVLLYLSSDREDRAIELDRLTWVAICHLMDDPQVALKLEGW